jgi:hypothetical protein
MPTTKHLPDQPIMKYVHPADRLRPWFGVATGLGALVVMLAFGILGRDFGTLKHLQALNDAGVWLTISLIEASAGILARSFWRPWPSASGSSGGWRGRTSSR